MQGRLAIPAAGLALLAALAGVAPAPAGTVTFYTDRSDFQNDSTNLVQESFEEGDVSPDGSTGCNDPFDQTTDDNCWDPGDIAPQLAVGSSSGTGTVIVGEDFLGAGYIVVGAGLPEDPTLLGFEGNETLAVGIDLHTLGDGIQVDLAVYGPEQALLDSTTVSGSVAGTFFGVRSPSPIALVVITAGDDNHELVGNVEFGPASYAQLGIEKTGTESPLGTVVYTLEVTNHGPLAATGVVVTDPLPEELDYVSDDCGGVDGSPWTWTIGPLAAHASATCHLTADVVTPGFIANTASVSGDQPDPTPFDDSSSVTLPLGLITPYDDALAFAAAVPGLVVEDFEEGDVAPASQTICSDPYDASTDDDCWDPGDIIPGLTVGTIDDALGTRIFGAGVYTDTISTGALEFSRPLYLLCDRRRAVGFDLFSGENESVTIEIHGSSETPLATVPVATGPAGVFFGFVSEVAIVGVVITSPGASGPILDNVRLGPPVDSDLSIEQSAVESPSGTVTLTVTATNHGPAQATGVVVTETIPAQLTYVSDDCGGTGTAPWTWGIGTLAASADATCHLTLSVATPGGVVAKVNIESESPDPNPDNNFDFLATAFVGAGPETPEEGFALFRSFPDVTIPDENGTPFSFRAHADKVILVQICAEWCGPCQEWTSKAPDLHAALATAIGADNFLLVDLLFQDIDASPSGQDEAADWKETFEFPGPVLHSENSNSSDLVRLYNDLALQYSQAPDADFGIPNFFILAPDCDNQIAVRGTPGVIQLGEERGIDTLSGIDDMAELVTGVWQDRTCVRPYVHKLDRCSAFEAPILAEPIGPDPELAEAAESFTVPAGREFDLGALTAVSYAGSSHVQIYEDDGGAPGEAVCTATAVSPTNYHETYVNRFAFSGRCRLTPGDYWVGLASLQDPETPIDRWLGGLLPSDGPFAFRDLHDLFGTGCTDWSSAETCFGPEAATAELCYVLEPPAGAIFLEGFEGAGTDGWSAAIGETP